MINQVLAGRLGVLLLFAASGIALSALLVRRMIQLAVMDVPVDRSAHERPTPRGGGVGPVAAVLLGVPAWLLLHPAHAGYLLPAALLLGSVALLAAVSWLDDLRQFPPGWKLLAQCLAALGAMLSLIVGPGTNGGAALYGWVGPLLSLPQLGWSAWLAPGLVCGAGFCWLLLCTNALNFIDGLNGLASGVCALCGALMVPVGLATADPLLVSVALMLAAGLLGFLPFNFPRARIFMGDVGSQPCGLLVGWFGLALLGDTGRPALALAVPLILAGVLGDVVFTLGRRMLRRERLTQAHRGHLYQVAARTGLARPAVTLIHWGFASWGGAMSLLLLPRHAATAMGAVLLPLLFWGWMVRQRARRTGLESWS